MKPTFSLTKQLPSRVKWRGFVWRRLLQHFPIIVLIGWCGSEWGGLGPTLPEPSNDTVCELYADPCIIFSDHSVGRMVRECGAGWIRAYADAWTIQWYSPWTVQNCGLVDKRTTWRTDAWRISHCWWWTFAWWEYDDEILCGGLGPMMWPEPSDGTVCELCVEVD